MSILLTEITKFLREPREMPRVVLLDNLDIAIERLGGEFDQDFWDGLGSLNSSTQGKIAFLFTAKAKFEETNHDFFLSSFYSSIGYRNDLGPLTPEDARALIDSDNLNLSESQINQICEKTGYHPFLLQAVCRELYVGKALDEGEGNRQRRRVPEVTKAIDTVIDETIKAYHFRRIQVKASEVAIVEDVHSSRWSSSDSSAYTHSPPQHPNFILGSLQLISWLILHPSAWRSHIRRISAGTLRPDFSLIEISGKHLQNTSIRRLIVQSYVLWPTIFGLLLGILCLTFSIPVPRLAFSLALGLVFGVGIGLGFGLPAGLPAGMLFGLIAVLLEPHVFSFWEPVAGGLSLGIASSLALSLNKASRLMTSGIWIGLLRVPEPRRLIMALRKRSLQGAARSTSNIAFLLVTIVPIAFGVVIGIVGVLAGSYDAGMKTVVASGTRVISSIGVDVSIASELWSGLIIALGNGAVAGLLTLAFTRRRLKAILVGILYGSVLGAFVAGGYLLEGRVLSSRMGVLLEAWHLAQRWEAHLVCLPFSPSRSFHATQIFMRKYLGPLLVLHWVGSYFG